MFRLTRVWKRSIPRHISSNPAHQREVVRLGASGDPIAVDVEHGVDAFAPGVLDGTHARLGIGNQWFENGPLRDITLLLVGEVGGVGTARHHTTSETAAILSIFSHYTPF